MPEQKLNIFIISLTVFFLLNSVTPIAYGSTRVYSIHIGSYKNKKKAEQKLSYLSKKSITGFYIRKGNTYHVYIGKFTGKPQALKKLNELWNSDVSTHYALDVISDQSPDTPIKKNNLPKIKPDKKSLPIATKIPGKPALSDIEKQLGQALTLYHEEKYEKAFPIFMNISR